MLLSAPYAVSGTDELVPVGICLRPRYAMSGTEVAYRTGWRSSFQLPKLIATVAPYAMPVRDSALCSCSVLP
eukprot:2779653-Rhodomonas_salina.1